MTGPSPINPRLRLLVAIASYGVGHLQYLKETIRTYQSMDMDVDVVVLSEAPKELGPGVEVIVGLPSKNPWTLPFAHKAVFVDRVNDYDLFVYSEDDIGVQESHLRAFLSATAQLASDEIAGFLRYEVDGAGRRFVAEPWGHYHWKPESVRQRGSYTVAEFTNEHAGFYVLTREQLRRAITSGGFLRGPYRGRYNWPETAATDPYTNCGFHKVICISALDDFLVHHMPNRYADGLPVSLAAFKEQIQTLLDIQRGVRPAARLCAAEIQLQLYASDWQKSYYEKPCAELLKMIPMDARNILSIGSGWGATEVRLKQRGVEVTAVSLDSVIGAVAASQGIKVVEGTWNECLQTLDGIRFDCVYMTNWLHLQPDPMCVLEQCASLVDDGGTLVLGGPNFDRIPWFIRRNFGMGEFRKLQSYNQSGISICGPGTLAERLRRNGFQVAAAKWLRHAINYRYFRGIQIPLGRFTAREWILKARR